MQLWGQKEQITRELGKPVTEDWHLKKSNGRKRRSRDPHTDVRSGGGQSKGREQRVYKRLELPGEPQVI